jgi:hypothetical protein
MSEHSEAPWRIDPAPSDAGSDALRGHILPHGAGEDDPCVAYVEGAGSGDLALMLAAPELLAALEAMLTACFLDYGPTENDDPQIVAAHRLALAAITRARQG